MEMLRRPVESALNSAIRMVDQAGRWPLPLDGHVQGFQGYLGMQGVAHAPAHDLAGVHVEDGGKIEPTFARRDIREISAPNLVGSLSREVALQPVGRDGVVMAAIRRSCPARQGCQPAYAGPAHQALDP